MAQGYKLTYPDGRTFVVKPGAEVSNDESLAAIRRHIDATAGVQAGPNPVTPTGPVPEIRASAPGVMPATTSLAEKVLTNPFAAKGSAQQESASSLARAVIPQTLGDVGMLAGMGSLPIMRALPIVGRAVSKLPGFLGRIIMGAVGDAAGEKIAGRSAMAGAAEGALGGVVGESAVGVGKAVGRGVGKIAGKMPVLGHALKARAAEKKAIAEAAAELKKTALNEANAAVRAANSALDKAKTAAEKADMLAFKRRSMEDRANVMAQSAEKWEAQAIAESKATAIKLGKQLEDITLGTFKARTGSELSNVGTRRLQSRDALGKTTRQMLAQSEGLVGADTKFKIPAMAEENPEFGDAAARVLSSMKEAKALSASAKVSDLPPAAVKALEDTYGPAQIEDFTLSEIADKFSDLGRAAKYPSDVAKGGIITKAGYPTRKTMEAAWTQLQAAMDDVPNGPDAFSTFKAGRHAMSVGEQLVTVMMNEGVFSRSETGALIDLPGLQRILRPHLGKLELRMTADEFKMLKDFAYPGGEPAAQATTTLAMRQAATLKSQSAAEKAAGRTIGAEGQALIASGAVPRAQAKLSLAETVRDKLATEPDKKSSWPFTVKELGQIYFDSAAQRTISELVRGRPTIEMTNTYDPSQQAPPPTQAEAPATLAAPTP